LRPARAASSNQYKRRRKRATLSLILVRTRRIIYIPSDPSGGKTAESIEPTRDTRPGVLHLAGGAARGRGTL